MEVYGYAIEYKPKTSPRWSRYWNHKIYRDERIANEAIDNMMKAPFLKDYEYRIVPLYNFNPQSL